MKGEKHFIHFISEDMGISSSQEEPIYSKNLDISGDTRVLFHMLCEAIDLNQEFKRLVELALKFNKEHDKENCPFCNPGKKN
jgi:hypothetical protein